MRPAGLLKLTGYLSLISALLACIGCVKPSKTEKVLIHPPRYDIPVLPWLEATHSYLDISGRVVESRKYHWQWFRVKSSKITFEGAPDGIKLNWQVEYFSIISVDRLHINPAHPKAWGEICVRRPPRSFHLMLELQVTPDSCAVTKATFTELSFGGTKDWVFKFIKEQQAKTKIKPHGIWVFFYLRVWQDAELPTEEYVVRGAFIIPRHTLRRLLPQIYKLLPKEPE